MTADFLQQLDDWVEEDYDWKATMRISKMPWKTTRTFCRDLNQSILDGTIDDKQVLFDENKYRPENAHPDEQQLIVCQHLLFHYQKWPWEVEHQNSPKHLPSCENLFVQGVAGSGKTFMFMTERNITIAVKGTGCAASIICAKTNCRASYLPHRGCDLHKKPHDSKATNTRIAQATRRLLSKAEIEKS